MICERCGEREAAVHLTRIINGEKEEMHLCEKCARKTSKFNFDDNLGFQSLLSGILNQNFSSQNSPKLNNGQSQNLFCKNCGLSYQEFAEKGFFGCHECYQTFADKLNPLLKRIHGNTQHSGKQPESFLQKSEMEFEIDELKEKMKQAVDEENFEKAAEIRDKIHAMKEDMEADDNEK